MKGLPKNKKLIPMWVVAVAAVVLLLIIISALSRTNAALSDFINAYLATPIRVVMAALTRALPFSLFELILLLILPTVILLVVLAVRDSSAARTKIRRIFAALGIVGILFSGYLVVMTIPYNNTPLAERLGIREESDIDTEELLRATVTARDEVNRLASEVERQGEVGIMPYSSDEASRLISEAYGSVREEYPFFYNFASRAKPVYFSGIMSDMGITGIYTYFTGEANVNTSFPDYCYTFTIAHEFAHQRGINRENEANFMAFFVLSRSEDVFLRYSAYLNIYEYLTSALYSADPELYREVNSELDPLARADIRAASEVVRAHTDSPLYTLMNRVNDAYLKSNGTEGVVSYGYVVRLAVGYFNSQGVAE